MVVKEFKDGHYYVTYKEGKRPLKFRVYWVDSDVKNEVLHYIIDFVTAIANTPKHLSKMEPDKFFALVERLSTLFCKEMSPTKNYGIEKAEIRSAVYFTMLAGIRAGDWPTEYEMDHTTFVQWSAEYKE